MSVWETTVTVTLDTGETFTGTGQRPWDAVVAALYREDRQVGYMIDWDDENENKWDATAGNVHRLDNDRWVRVGRWVRT